MLFFATGFPCLFVLEVPFTLFCYGYQFQGGRCRVRGLLKCLWWENCHKQFSIIRKQSDTSLHFTVQNQMASWLSKAYCSILYMLRLLSWGTATNPFRYWHRPVLCNLQSLMSQVLVRASKMQLERRNALTAAYLFEKLDQWRYLFSYKLIWSRSNWDGFNYGDLTKKLNGCTWGAKVRIEHGMLWLGKSDSNLGAIRAYMKEEGTNQKTLAESNMVIYDKLICPNVFVFG